MMVCPHDAAVECRVGLHRWQSSVVGSPASIFRLDASGAGSVALAWASISSVSARSFSVKVEGFYHIAWAVPGTAQPSVSPLAVAVSPRVAARVDQWRRVSNMPWRSSPPVRSSAVGSRWRGDVEQHRRLRRRNADGAASGRRFKLTGITGDVRRSSAVRRAVHPHHE